MDARERYDPEDLEALLSERTFDELLAEERAFVLRHVADRTEYDTLRTTLAQVRAHGRPGPMIIADPEVRDRVLEAFREARRPAWRIWLNSVGTWLMPPKPAFYWRPALALGTLALLIAVGIAVWAPVPDDRQEGLAELKPAPPPEPASPAKNTDPGLTKTGEQPSSSAGAGAQSLTEQAPAKTEVLHTATTDGDMDGSAMAEVPAEADRAMEEEPSPAQAAAMVEELPLFEQQAAATGVAAAPPAVERDGGRTRAASEDVRSTSGTAKMAKESMDGEASASLGGGNADLLGLMRAAW